ncbi:MAG: RluA family pseudouridine synthase [Planctomycetales bacterium]|nr:RluA family pseudouridine synthase [Planctomycetales bacterium]MBN8623849.1 RluA family pseudouridine synthase [Planctomycetota bacterium]
MTATFVTVYQDDRLLVLEKPSGLLAVPGRGPDLQDCLSSRVQAAYPTALVVHRLDRDTSGVFLMALDPAAQRELSRQFEARETEKRYSAVVAGTPEANEGLVDLPLRKDFDRPPRHMVDHVHGRPSQTRWRVVERWANGTRLAVEPITGRSHQIRIHLAAIGLPILGDPLYAPDDVVVMAPRLMLHAEMLVVRHPEDGRLMTFTSACPF